jgi:hypothetical protein
MAVPTWLNSVDAATTGNISGWTSTGGGTFASPPGSVDNVLINVTGMRVLAKDQATPSQNGVYVLQAGGSWLISPSSTDNLLSGSAVRVKGGGTVNAYTEWALRDQTSSYQWVKQILRVTLPRVEQVLDHTRESATAHSL